MGPVAPVSPGGPVMPSPGGPTGPVAPVAPVAPGVPGTSKTMSETTSLWQIDNCFQSQPLRNTHEEIFDILLTYTNKYKYTRTYTINLNQIQTLQQLHL